MIQNVINFISGKLLRLESRLGLFFSSLVIATVMLACAMLYAQPVLTVAFHGIQFSLLSEHPFDFSLINPMRYRILSPLIGYLFFLRGTYFFILPLLVTWLLIGTVYYQYRRKNFEAIDAFLLTCFISFSCVVLIPLVAPGYTDVVTWFLVFLAFIKAEKPGVSATFYALALLNHESSAVVLPAMLLYAWSKNKNAAGRILTFYLLACLPHLCYRWYVNAHSATLYNLSFYLSEKNVLFTLKRIILFGPVAAFYTFKLWWLLPLCLAGFTILRKKKLQASILVLILAGTFSLIIISYDYTRMLVIAFPAVLLSYEWLLEMDKAKLRKFTIVLVALNFLILQYHFNYDGAQPMFPWILNKFSAMLGTPLN